MSEQTVSIANLYVHPVKSCARIEQGSALVTETGLEWDRQWMVVDEQGEFVSQRDEPRLALVRPTLRANDLVLRAPGMLALHLALDAIESETTVQVWNDRVHAGDMGDLAAQWFSDFLGRRARLARFDPEVQRVSDRKWTGDTRALTAFADGFALLVVSSASLAELNRRLAASGAAAVSIRPLSAQPGARRPGHPRGRLDRSHPSSTPPTARSCCSWSSRARVARSRMSTRSAASSTMR